MLERFFAKEQEARHKEAQQLEEKRQREAEEQRRQEELGQQEQAAQAAEEEKQRNEAAERQRRQAAKQQEAEAQRLHAEEQERRRWAEETEAQEGAAQEEARGRRGLEAERGRADEEQHWGQKGLGVRTFGNKVRIYDLAKELKLESKRLIEEVRREGYDVSVPSNTVPKELAEKIRNRYFPKKEAAPQRSIRVVKKARHEGDEHGDIHVSVPPGAAGQADAKPTTAVRLVKKPLPPAAYAEPPGAAVGAQKPALADVSYPTRVVTHKIEMELVMVPPGSFMMGSENGFLNEKPIHRVTISQGFFIGKYQVTQAQWQEVMGNNPSRFKGCEDCPVEMVSWEDAQEFLHKLNEMNSEYTYRLPTEAEWEYAARAGMMGDYAGDLGAIAWYDKNSDIKTHPVGHKQPNAFGLFDMHGNVWEWVQDWYHNSYVGAPTDGTAWLSDGEQKKRVVRGGSWSNAADFLRPSYRLRYNPSLHFDHCGFRVAGVARP